MLIIFLKALRNSGLNIVYITGLTKELKYPNHVVSMNAATPGWQDCDSFVQRASSMLHVKNGTQHMRKTPAKNIRKQKKEIWQR